MALSDAGGFIAVKDGDVAAHLAIDVGIVLAGAEGEMARAAAGRDHALAIGEAPNWPLARVEMVAPDVIGAEVAGVDELAGGIGGDEVGERFFLAGWIGAAAYEFDRRVQERPRLPSALTGMQAMFPAQ